MYRLGGISIDTNKYISGPTFVGIDIFNVDGIILGKALKEALATRRFLYRIDTESFVWCWGVVSERTRIDNEIKHAIGNRNDATIIGSDFEGYYFYTVNDDTKYYMMTDYEDAKNIELAARYLSQFKDDISKIARDAACEWILE